jgi:hypothetical protein
VTRTNPFHEDHADGVWNYWCFKAASEVLVLPDVAAAFLGLQRLPPELPRLPLFGLWGSFMIDRAELIAFRRERTQ